MKGLRFLLLLVLCFLFAMSVASANINIDEDFTDDTPFTDLHNSAGVSTGTSSTLKGINVCDDPDNNKGVLQYNATSAFTQGSLFTIDAAHNARCWKLDAGQQLFWGQSGWAGQPSGLSNLSVWGGGIEAAQVAVAVEPATALKAAGTNVGSISYFFGDTKSTHTLDYNLVTDGSGNVDVIPVRAGVTGASIGSFQGDKWALITTVWADKDSAADQTGNTDQQYWDTNPDPTKAIGWPRGTRLNDAAHGTCIYSFMNANPLGTVATPAFDVDSPWTLAHPAASDENGGKIRTWRIQAASSDALYVDDLYLEAGIRSGNGNSGTGGNYDGKEPVGNLRMHPFNKTYPVLGGVPVELSVFEVR